MSQDKLYTITKHKRRGAGLTWYIWILSEYSLPDSQGNFMRVRTIADFGNTKHKENYQNAKALKLTLEKGI